MPPEAGKISPVSQPESDEARNSAMGPISLGLPRRPSGVCWLIVVLAHVAERMHVISRMGWGLLNSPGHYLDLISAVVGTLLVLAAFVAFLFSHRNRT